jgi:galactitol-specific phosphotransferase system IIB component
MSSSKWTVRVLAALACCVASLGFAACGGGGDSTSSTTSSTAAETGASGQSGTASSSQIEQAFRDGLAQQGITGADADCVVNEIQNHISGADFLAAVQQHAQTGQDDPKFTAALSASFTACNVTPPQ